jgi:hypothetical protein
MEVAVDIEEDSLWEDQTIGSAVSTVTIAAGTEVEGLLL